MLSGLLHPVQGAETRRSKELRITFGGEGQVEDEVMSVRENQIPLLGERPATRPGGREGALKKMLTPAFSRHETFHPRFAWLKKGFDLACKAPFGFGDNDTAFELGVGKNMARAIRYWCVAFKVVEERYDPAHKRRGVFPTRFGRDLLADDGWDPYLEDDASLWLLHWNLLRAPNFATTWFFTFFCFPVLSFQTEQLVNALSDFKDSVLVDGKVVRNSLQRDANCLLRMYSEIERRGGISDDNLDSPFARLGLIAPELEAKRFSFSVGEKPSLPAAIVVSACLQYAKSVSGGAQSIAMNRLLFDVGAPGMAFKLYESCLVDAFEDVIKDVKGLSLQDSSGALQVGYKKDPEELASDLINQWYSGK